MSVEQVMARLEKKVMAERIMPLALEIQAGARQNLSGDVLDVDSGNLRNSVQIAVTGPLEVQVGVVASPHPETGVPASTYGAAWEFGHRLQPARPWMRPAVAAVKARLRR